MNGIAMACAEDYKPSICFHDKQIERYLPEKFDQLKVDDEISLTLKFKVVSVSKRESMEYDYNEKGERSKEQSKKMRKSVDLELVSAGKNPVSDGKAMMQINKGLK